MNDNIPDGIIEEAKYFIENGIYDKPFTKDDLFNWLNEQNKLSNESNNMSYKYRHLLTNNLVRFIKDSIQYKDKKGNIHHFNDFDIVRMFNEYWYPETKIDGTKLVSSLLKHIDNPEEESK